jgi:hypothetical protein
MIENSNIKNLNWQLFPNIPTLDFYTQVMQKNLWGKTFQSECDWCIGSRYPYSGYNSITKKSLLFGDPSVLPRVIFVNLEGNLLFFMKDILPSIPQNHKFVLIIGDSDHTFPQQLDIRYKEKFLDVYEKLITDNRVLHIFCTHLDLPRNEKISPLPSGFDFLYFQPSLEDKFNLDINSKELKIFNCDRIREGMQWEDRRIVKRICSNEWSAFSVCCQNELDINHFNKYLNENSFMLCPHGGGLEPNPKVFHALLLGSIPIVKKFVNCEFLYQDLPVVFIPDWKPEYVTIEKLKTWRESFKDYFYNQDKRKQVLYKLTTDYWKEYIQKQSKVDFQLFSC